MRFLILLFIFVLALTGQLFASEKYYFSYDGSVVSIPIFKYRKFKVNDVCLKNIKTCNALKSISKKYPRPIVNPKVSSIAQVHCKNLGGHPIIMKDEEMNMASFCMFKDKTIIDSWSIYNFHFKEKNNK